MKVLLDILYANSLADLPDFCRPLWEDEDKFQDWFVMADDDTKVDVVADCVRRCLEMNIRDERNALRMLMYCANGSGNEYEDEEQEVVIPTLDAPTPVAVQPVSAPRNDAEVQRLTRKLEQANAEIETLKAELERITHEQTERPKPAPKNPEEKRGRGRPPKNPENSELKCHLCHIGFASFGARYNHYISKQHTEACLCMLEKVRKVVQQDDADDRNLKLRVEARSHLYDPEFTTENPTPREIDGIVEYVKTNKKNPIADLVFVEGKTQKYLSGKTYISWKSVEL